MNAPATLAATLRGQILDGDLAPGTPLREQHLAAHHDLARHTVRAALRALAAEGLVRVEPNRGARVAQLGRAELESLGDLRIALEVEAARLALAKHGGALPPEVHAACRALGAAGPGFAAVTSAHEALHGSIVTASQSPRIIAAHQALAGELRLFLVQLKPAWNVENLANEHETLLAAIEADGPEALRPHIEASTNRLTSGLKL